MEAAVRDARDDEAGAIADLLSRAAFGPTVSRLVAFPRTSPHGDVLVVDNREAVAVLDRAATGEDRSNLLSALHPLSGVAAERDGTLVGWAAKAPYGAGVAICG